jgi:hypothetical protein
MTASPGVSTSSAARLAGYGYLIIFVLAVFANFLALSTVVDPGDASATVANIGESRELFRGGLIGFTVVFVLDVAIAWALYIFFRGVNRDVALLTAWFRLVYTMMLGVGLVFYFLVLSVIDGSSTSPDANLGQTQVMLFLDAFDYAWLLGLVCFGVHLVLLGRLALRAGFIPKAIGVLLIAAGIAYVLDTAAHALLSNYGDYESLFLAMVAVPSVMGEGAFAMWLLFRGSRRDYPPAASTHLRRRTLEPAAS